MTSSPSPWADFETTLEEARAAFAALINAPPENVAVMPNTSIAAFQAVSTHDFGPRPRVLALPGEFPSLGQVWRAQRQRGASVVTLPDLPGAELEAACAEALGEDVAMVCLASVNYLDGGRRPVAAIAERAHEVGAQVLVDAYQSAGVDVLDVEQLGCDFLVAGTSKYLLGLPGIAFLYARDAERGLAPVLTGWFGRPPADRFEPTSTVSAAGAARFETGTPAVPAVYAGLAGLRLIDSLDLVAVRRHVERMVAVGLELMAGAGLEVIGPTASAQRGAHLAVAVADPPAVAAQLARVGVMVSPRGHTIRLACHYFTDEEDLRRACAALASGAARD